MTSATTWPRSISVLPKPNLPNRISTRLMATPKRQRRKNFRPAISLPETLTCRPRPRRKPLGHSCSQLDMQVVMTEHLAGLFGSAVGILASSQSRSFELVTEITTLDETACDAWVGRIRCGDTDRVTLFRAWYSRANFGKLAGSAEIPMNSLNARIPIGGMFGDITYPISSPLAITMGFAAHEASIGNYADAMEAL